MAGFRPRRRPTYRVGDRVHYCSTEYDSEGEPVTICYPEDTGTVVDLESNTFTRSPCGLAIEFDNEPEGDPGGARSHPFHEVAHCPWQGWRPLTPKDKGSPRD